MALRRAALLATALLLVVQLLVVQRASCAPTRLPPSAFGAPSGLVGSRFLVSSTDRFTAGSGPTSSWGTIEDIGAFIQSDILSVWGPSSSSTAARPSLFSMRNLPVLFVDCAEADRDAMYARLAALEAEGLVVEDDAKVFVLQERRGAPDDPLYREGRQWGLEKIGASELWREGIVGSKALDVVVIDTGLDVDHPDIISNVGINEGEIPNNGIDDDGNGFNSISGNGDVYDGNGHGTHAAGILAATGNNSLGIAGTALEVSLRPCKFLDDSGGGRISDALRCLDWALEIGAPVSSNSWGGGGFSRVFSDMLDVLEERGHLFVAAAGNINSPAEADQRCPFYPAAYAQSNVLSVAATDTDDCLTSFSCASRNGIDVHVAAPGLNIISTYPGSDYRRLSGTSMACPFVAGLAALLLCHPGQDCSRGSVGPRQIARVKQAIVSSTVDPSGCLAGAVSSGGRIDAARALEAFLSPPSSSSDWSGQQRQLSSPGPSPAPQPSASDEGAAVASPIASRAQQQSPRDDDDGSRNGRPALMPLEPPPSDGAFSSSSLARDQNAPGPSLQLQAPEGPDGRTDAAAPLVGPATTAGGSTTTSLTSAIPPGLFSPAVAQSSPVRNQERLTGPTSTPATAMTPAGARPIAPRRPFTTSDRSSSAASGAAAQAAAAAVRPSSSGGGPAGARPIYPLMQQSLAGTVWSARPDGAEPAAGQQTATPQASDQSQPLLPPPSPAMSPIAPTSSAPRKHLRAAAAGDNAAGLPAEDGRGDDRPCHTVVSKSGVSQALGATSDGELRLAVDPSWCV